MYDEGDTDEVILDVLVEVEAALGEVLELEVAVFVSSTEISEVLSIRTELVSTREEVVS